MKWITSYLEYWTQFTNVGKYNSTMVATTRGMPQGSILGPLLYLIFTNEMSEVIRDINCPNTAHSNNSRIFGEHCTTCGQLLSYSDDATYQVSSTNRTQNQLRINLNLARLEMYLTDNKLIVNTGKTSIVECMIKQKWGRLGVNPPFLVVPTPQGNLKEILDN